MIEALFFIDSFDSASALQVAASKLCHSSSSLVGDFSLTGKTFRLPTGNVGAPASLGRLL